MTTSTTPLTFDVNDNSYLIKKITVGNLLDIEKSKSLLSNGQYGLILGNRTKWSEYTLDNIDMFAHLTVMTPQLIKDLKVDHWKDLDPFDLEDLKKQYRKQFIPWFNKFGEALFKVIEGEDDDNKKKPS